MAIRIVLNNDGDVALKEIAKKLKMFNPALSKFQNTLASQAMVDLKESLTEAKVRKLAEKLLSRPGKKKILLNQIAVLANKLDEESFQSMEAGLKKMLGQFEKVPAVSVEELLKK